MNGNVFECYDEQTDRRQFAKTMEALQQYAKKNLKYYEDTAPLFAVDMATPTISKPVAPEKIKVGEVLKMDETDEAIWKEELKDYVHRGRVLNGNLAAIHAVIWGQCSEAMKAKVKASKVYDEKMEANDCYWLLKQIKAVTLQFDEKHNCFISLMDAKMSFYNCKQQRSQTCDSYREELKGWVDTIEYHGGSIGESFELVPAVDADGNPLTVAERTTIARDRTLAIAYIRGADTSRYGSLIKELANRYARGKDEYPFDLNDAYSALVDYATPVNTGGRTWTTPTATMSAAPEAGAMTFAQHTLVPGTDGATYATITCFRCEGVGHYADRCPSDSDTASTAVSSAAGTTLLQHAYMLAQSKATGIDPHWILLDSQSTISVFKNKAMLNNVRRSPHTLRAITNGGHQDSEMVGDFPNLGEVWYNPASIANILSLADVSKVCRVTMDTTKERAMCVHRLDGSVMKFKEHPSGLYVFANNGSSPQVTAYTMLSTVAAQKKLFSQREIKAADRARALYRKIGRPAEAEFQALLRRNLIQNCPVTADDAKRALIIYGPDVATLKGKMTHNSASERVPTYQAVPIPPSVLKHHSQITLCIDFFFVQGHPFFHTISRAIGFRTVASVPDRSHDTILREVHLVINLYRSRGFTVVDIHSDKEFECIKAEIRPIHMDIVPADRHVGEVERSVKLSRNASVPPFTGFRSSASPSCSSFTSLPTPCAVLTNFRGATASRAMPALFRSSLAPQPLITTACALSLASMCRFLNHLALPIPRSPAPLALSRSRQPATPPATIISFLLPPVHAFRVTNELSFRSPILVSLALKCSPRTNDSPLSKLGVSLSNGAPVISSMTTSMI